MDWILLVPLELASNAVEMKGFSNMEDYKTAFADKGVIGSMLEFGGSTYLVYRAADDLLDRNKKNKSRQNQDQTEQPGGTTPESPTTPTTPTTPEPPVIETPPVPTDSWLFFSSEGEILSSSYWELGQ